MKIYRLLFLLSLWVTLFVGCADDNYMELDKGSSPLEITASSAEIELDAANPTSEALKLSWTTGSNQGTNAGISYTFQMDLQGDNFAGGVSIDLGRGVYEKIYKNEELNEILLNNFGVEVNKEVVLEARVIATIAAEGIEPEISNLQRLSVKTHKPITKTLYMLGDATPNGWNAGEATEMRPISNVPKGFTWTGSLSPGNVKFITTLGEFAPSYNKGESDTKLYLRESFDDPYDEQFEITEGGTYTVKVNLITLTISIVRGEGPEYSELWFVGNPTGWSFQPMAVNPVDPFIFHYNGDLSAGGEFKIGTAAGNWDAPFFRPTVDKKAEGIGLDVDKWAGDPDYKWNITGGVYKIKLDTRDMKIDIVPFVPFEMIYLVGDASPNGWDIGNATPMTATADPYKFTWSGSLKGGELKFTCDKQSDWNGAWFIASEADKSPTGQTEQMLFNYPGAGVDYKWRISESGTYKIELDQLKETITIQKQ
ncbi:SusF/SusE family outer membrane protein [Proteiniphilum sp. UBA5431]|uniref:SusF/SusE family outer membrane protein n=2 Tax=unclassified Proteiniphilum TaxID=2622718 RepID=UPI00257C6DA9|nr:SusF/SusE family outer membrane protein [Proteiniphilum sp. UBA5431]